MKGLDREFEVKLKRSSSRVGGANIISCLDRAFQSSSQKSSLREFIQAGWHVLEPSTQFRPGRHIDAICFHLEALQRGDIRNLLITMPPRHMKSLACTVFFDAWVWASRPHERFINSSYAQNLSTRDSRKFRNLISSDWYQSQWGSVFSLTGDQNTKIEIVNNKTGHRLATAVGSATTGKGGSYIKVDDCLKASDASSLAKRSRCVDWWSEEMSTRGNDEYARRLIVMQRLHEDDLAGYVLNSEVEYCHLNLPARFEGNNEPNLLGWRDWRQKEGELLWPEGCSEARLRDLEKALGNEYAIAGQLQQRPAPRAGGIIKRDWILTGSVEGQIDRVIISADFSHGSMSRKASYNVFSAWAQIGSNVFLLEVERFRAEFPEALQRFKAFCIRHPQAAAKLVEDKAMGRSVIQTLRRSMPGIVPINPGDRDKVARLESVAPFFQAGNVHVVPRAQWRTAYVHELTTFPSGHDDQVDVTSQALNYLFGTPSEVYASFL